MSSSELNFNNTYERIVVLVDMDCFYCQVEEKLNPELRGKPMAVVQYNAWMGGGIIAVNYAARARGVTRHMRGDEARKHCPEIELVKVPSVREKADLTKYRDAGKDVARVLQSFTPNLERASVDEAYLDISSNVIERMKEMDRGEYFIEPQDVTNTFAVGHKSFGDFVRSLSARMSSGSQDEEEVDEMEDFRAANASCKSQEKDVKKRNELKLLVAATIVNDIRRAVKEETGYECSAGIAHNKILAKLVAGLNKPNKQTIVSIDAVVTLFEDMPILKVRGLGGKFGEIVCQKLNVKFMGDLLEFTESELRKAFNDKDGTWLYYLARGIDLEPVVPRLISKSIGCCKKFPGKGAITGVKTLTHWLKELASEVVDRLEKDHEENNRRGRLLTVSFTQAIGGEDIASSRSVPLDTYDVQKIADDAFEVMRKNTDVFYVVENPAMLQNPIKLLGLSVSKFEKNPAPKKNRIQEMFRMQETKKKEEEAKEEENTEGFFEQYLEKGTQEHTDDHTESPTKDSPGITLPETPEKPEQEDALEGSSKDFNDSDGFLKQFIEKETEDLLLEESPEKCPPEELPEAPEETSTPEYKKTYAEFARPQLPEEFTTICEMCNKRISHYEAASHSDYHFALQLSQEQRTVFRKEIKEKIVVPPPAKKLKTSKPAAKTSPSVSIKSFFSRTQEAREAGSAGKLTEKCPECGKNIPVEEITEHADYHIARRLQMEMNQTNSQTWSQTNQEKTKKSAPKASSSKFPNIASYFSSS